MWKRRMNIWKCPACMQNNAACHQICLLARFPLLLYGLFKVSHYYLSIRISAIKPNGNNLAISHLISGFVMATFLDCKLYFSAQAIGPVMTAHDKR